MAIVHVAVEHHLAVARREIPDLFVEEFVPGFLPAGNAMPAKNEEVQFPISLKSSLKLLPRGLQARRFSVSPKTTVKHRRNRSEPAVPVHLHDVGFHLQTMLHPAALDHFNNAAGQAKNTTSVRYVLRNSRGNSCQLFYFFKTPAITLVIKMLANHCGAAALPVAGSGASIVAAASRSRTRARNQSNHNSRLSSRENLVRALISSRLFANSERACSA